MVLAVALLLPVSAQAQTRPKLSAEIASVLEQEGVEAAQRRFDEIVPARASEYEVDLEGFGELATRSMQSGDMATMQAISEMVGKASQYMTSQMMAGGMVMPGVDMGAMRAAEEAQRQADAEAAARASAGGSNSSGGAAPTMRDTMGEPREDLERFVGQYGDPDAQGDIPRNLFATVRCDGYLVAGATWGDAALWHMRSTSDTDFEMEDNFTGRVIRISFTLGPDGTPQSMAHNVDFIESPLPFLGGLPEEWGTDCIRPPGG
jgi:hypothetical protein